MHLCLTCSSGCEPSFVRAGRTGSQGQQSSNGCQSKQQVEKMKNASISMQSSPFCDFWKASMKVAIITHHHFWTYWLLQVKIQSDHTHTHTPGVNSHSHERGALCLWHTSAISCASTHVHHTTVADTPEVPTEHTWCVWQGGMKLMIPSISTIVPELIIS